MSKDIQRYEQTAESVRSPHEPRVRNSHIIHDALIAFSPVINGWGLFTILLVTLFLGVYWWQHPHNFFDLVFTSVNTLAGFLQILLWLLVAAIGGLILNTIFLPFIRGVKELFRPVPIVHAVNEHFALYSGKSVQVHDHREDKSVYNYKINAEDAPAMRQDQALALPPPSTIPSLVRYEDVKALVPRGHTLLGTGINGIETRPFGVLSTTWIVGGSKTGKTTTVSLKVQEAYELGCWFCVIDPHRWKDDSLYNSIKGYSHRFLSPGVAVKPAETLAALKAFLHQAQARLDGSSTDRTPIVLIVDEVNHICNIGGLEGEDLALRKEIVSLLKSIAAMCGEELRGYNMFGWFISQKAAHLAWLRNSAMTVIAHKVLMMSERSLACNEDSEVARSMDTWPIGRVMVYGLDFPDGHLITQMPHFTSRVVDADPSSNLNNNPSTGRYREEAPEAVGRTLEEKNADSDVSVKILRDIGKRLRNGEDRAKILRSYDATKGRANQEIGAVIDMVKAEIESEVE